MDLSHLQVKVEETRFDRPLSGVQGWLSPGEQSALYALALYTHHPILEIGPWVGLSTACIAYGVRDSGKQRIFVTAEINPDSTDFGPIGNGDQIGFFLPGDEETRGTCSVREYKRLVQPILSKPGRAIGELRENLTRLGLIDIVTIFEGTFSRAPNFGYGFVFCDATHNPYEISLTARGLQPYLAAGTILACHDIDRQNEEALRHYISFDVSFKVDSLFVGQVAHQCHSLEESAQNSKGPIQPALRISEEPTVSVVVPSHNRAHLIGRAILSILNQTYHDLELIIVDDASTDRTPQVIEAFDDPRIRYIRHESNKGAAAARNTGIEASRGRYVAFQDSDDEWLPHKLERQVDALKDSSLEVGVVYSSFWLIRDNERIVLPSRIRRLVSYLPSETRKLDGDIHRALSRANFISTQATLIRRTCFDTMGLFDENLSRFQDWELWLRISEKYRFKYIDEPLVIAYATPGNLTSDQTACVEALDVILQKHYRERKQENNELLAHYLNAMGDILFRSEDHGCGRSYLFRAVKSSPFNTAYWITALASLLGRSVYGKIVNAFGIGYTIS